MLDVQLDERIDVLARRARHFGWVEAELPHRGRDFGIDGVDRARDRAGAPEVRLEARAFLFTDRDDFKRALGLSVGFEQRFDGGESRDDAECAVEPAAVTHRVDVRAGDDRFPTPLSPSPQIPDRVPPGFETGVPHPAFDPLTGGCPGAAVERPIRSTPSVGLGADGVELVEPAFEQRAVNSHDGVSGIVPSRPCR